MNKGVKVAMIILVLILILAALYLIISDGKIDVGTGTAKEKIDFDAALQHPGEGKIDFDMDKLEV
jgi:hypothetical protein